MPQNNRAFDAVKSAQSVSRCMDSQRHLFEEINHWLIGCVLQSSLPVKTSLVIRDFAHQLNTWCHNSQVQPFLRALNCSSPPHKTVFQGVQTIHGHKICKKGSSDPPCPAVSDRGASWSHHRTPSGPNRQGTAAAGRGHTSRGHYNLFTVTDLDLRLKPYWMFWSTCRVCSLIVWVFGSHRNHPVAPACER